MGQGREVALNPLPLPKWSKKKKKIPEARKVHNYIGLKSEAVREDAGAKSHIVISVQGVKSMPSGSYSVAYLPGQSLGKYLSRLKLKRTAIYSAVYDSVHGGNKRLRMTYVPKEGSRITIGSIGHGPVTHLQRTTVDAQRVALNMGGLEKVVERKK